MLACESLLVVETLVNGVLAHPAPPGLHTNCSVALLVQLLALSLLLVLPNVHTEWRTKCRVRYIVEL